MSAADTPHAVIRPLGQPGDLGWVVMAHGEIAASAHRVRGRPTVGGWSMSSASTTASGLAGSYDCVDRVVLNAWSPGRRSESPGQRDRWCSMGAIGGAATSMARWSTCNGTFDRTHVRYT